MDRVLERAPVKRAQAAMTSLGLSGRIHVLESAARTAADAAIALSIQVGQIASSLLFRLPDGSPVLIITSGKHKVDTNLVASNLEVDQLLRAEANYVKTISGYSVGGVSPVGWLTDDHLVLIDQSLAEFEVIWAAAGHPHTVFPTTYNELCEATRARPMIVSG